MQLKTKEEKLLEEIQSEELSKEKHQFSPILLSFDDEKSKFATVERQEEMEELRQLYLNKILKKALNALDAKKDKNMQLIVD